MWALENPFASHYACKLGLIEQTGGGAIGWSAKGNPGSLSHGIVPGGRPYRFHLQTHALPDFAALCRCHQTSLQSDLHAETSRLRGNSLLAGSP